MHLDVDVVLDSDRIDRESDGDVLIGDDEYGVWRMMFRIKCSLGQSNPVGQKFCGECGRRLRKDSDTVVPVHIPEPSPQNLQRP